jgi:23S rRNA (adenine2503-C2)-methyltransferase
MTRADANRVNLLDFDRPGLEAWFAGLGEKPFRAVQVLKWIHQQGITDFDAMSNLSKALRQRLMELTEVRLPEVITEQTSDDGTRKWMLRLAGGNAVETVFIPEVGRGTLCISSQVGCPLDCSFCATGKQGFNRNLGTAEILGQIFLAARLLGQFPCIPERRKISNVVFMGMGEPLLNFDNVVRAINVMLDDNAYGLSRRRVTVSTAGVVPVMDRLKEASPVSLAVSLHAPDDALRDQLVPLNRTYPLKELLAACKRFARDYAHEEITFEYVMLDGVNDSPAQARALVRLLSGVPAKVNLIPWNPVVDVDYRRSSPEAIERFRAILQQAGLVTVTRKTRGDDIDAACGQLVGRVEARAARHRRERAGRVKPGDLRA